MTELRGGDYEFSIKGVDELRAAARLGDGRGVQRELPGAPPGRRRGVRPPLQHRAGAGRPRARRRRPTRRCCSAGGCGTRRASRSSSSRSTRAARAPRARGAGRASTSATAGCEHSVLEIYREDVARFRTLVGDRARRGPARRARRGARCPSSRRCACTTARSTAGTAPATASPTASRTCASRTACCPSGPTHRRRDRQRRVLVRPDAARLAARYDDITKVHGVRARQA